MKNHSVFIALGANLPSAKGAPVETLQAALARLSDLGAPAEAVAQWRRSAAFPAGSGPDFVNGAARLATDLDGPALLALLHQVEEEMGRIRAERWGPRVCDLDLIAMGANVAPDVASLSALIALGPDRAAANPPSPGLALPHPRMQERAFVLAPLAEVAGTWRHPILKQTAEEMLTKLPKMARQEVVLL